MAKTYDVWQVTKNLRFLNRAVIGADNVARRNRVLQQEWKMRTRGYGWDEWKREWRDVPEEREGG